MNEEERKNLPSFRELVEINAGKYAELEKKPGTFLYDVGDYVWLKKKLENYDPYTEDMAGQRVRVVLREVRGLWGGPYLSYVVRWENKEARFEEHELYSRQKKHLERAKVSEEERKKC